MTPAHSHNLRVELVFARLGGMHAAPCWWREALCSDNHFGDPGQSVRARTGIRALKGVKSEVAVYKNKNLPVQEARRFLIQ